MSWTLRVALQSARLQLQVMAREPFVMVLALLQPFFIAVTAMFMLRYQPGFDPVYVVVGGGLAGIWTVVLFAGSWVLAGERWQGTLELLEGSPAPMLIIVGGRMLANVAFSLLSMILSYSIGAWLFGYRIAFSQPAAFAVSLLLALLALWAMGMLFAPLSVLWPAAQRYLQGLEYPVYILSGFLFPVLLLPGWLRPVSYLLPPYWAAVALHGTGSGGITAPGLVGVWAVLLVTAAALVALAAWLLERFLVRARRNGTLSFV